MMPMLRHKPIHLPSAAHKQSINILRRDRPASATGSQQPRRLLGSKVVYRYEILIIEEAALGFLKNLINASALR